MKRLIKFFILTAIILGICFPACAYTQHVVLLSIDGLNPQSITAWGEKKLPHFYQLMKEGSFTLNARTDVDFANTLPNHTCMITSKPVLGLAGHNMTFNDVTDKTIHDYKGTYVESIFDVLNQNNLVSSMSTSKLKFRIYSRSYHITDAFITDGKDGDTLTYAIKQLSQDSVPAFIFLHLAGMDITGHHFGWSQNVKSKYMRELLKMDKYLGKLMNTISKLNDDGKPTVLLVTADHGGTGLNHGDAKNKSNYTIPFIAWGAGVAHGMDLYELNKSGRLDPKADQISYANAKQPIRNGEAANLALHLLGLGCVPHSSIGCEPVLKLNIETQ